MTADPHTLNSTPRRALRAPLAAWTPPAGASRRPEEFCGPHSGSQGFDPPLDHRFTA